MAISLKPILVDAVKQEETQKAATILKYTRDSAKSLLEAYELMRGKRGAARGMTTDAEQDVLRAMLVMAAAGLDGMVKRLIRDSLPKLVNKDGRVKNGLEKFIAQQIRGDTDVLESRVGAKFLASVLSSPRPQKRVIEAYIRSLTGGSLQSADELMKVTAAFGLEPAAIGIEPEQLKGIFDIRNKIIHELDIDLEGDRRKRNLRAQQDMADGTDKLLGVGLRLLTEVDGKLGK